MAGLYVLRFRMMSNEIYWDGLREVLYAYVDSRLPRKLRRHVGVSDILQSVFVAAKLHEQQFRGETEAEFRRWLFRIAQNKIVDSIRRYRQRTCPPKLRGTDFVPRNQATVDRTADTQMIYAEQSRRLLESIAILPQDIRRIILLRYTRELGFPEIAAELGMAETTCRRRWYEGLRLLGDLLR